MASNLTIESPNFDKIRKEAGQFTSDAVKLLWEALNDTRATERRDINLLIRSFTALSLSPAASVDNQALGPTSAYTVVSFLGGSGQNLTGFKAPETGQAKLLFLQVSGAGTITVKHNATSETANRIITSSGADTALTTGKGMVLAYLASNWRQVV